LSEALRFYDKALGIQPRNTRLLRNKAGTLSWAGRHRESADAYLSAALTEPVFPRVWLNLGIELERAGSPDSAAAALRKALAQDSRSIEALNRLARLLLRESGTREEAYRLIEESLRLAPGQTNAPEMKAILVRAGRGEAAAGD
jgi:Tfp pilus assembly protein PilF